MQYFQCLRNFPTGKTAVPVKESPSVNFDADVMKGNNPVGLYSFSHFQGLTEFFSPPEKIFFLVSFQISVFPDPKSDSISINNTWPINSNGAAGGSLNARGI